MTTEPLVCVEVLAPFCLGDKRAGERVLLHADDARRWASRGAVRVLDIDEGNSDGPL